MTAPNITNILQVWSQVEDVALAFALCGENIKPPVNMKAELILGIIKAFLRLKKTDLAQAEFQKIIQNRSWAAHSPLFALAHRQLSEVYKMQGNVEKARNFAEQFTALWKTADVDLQVLKLLVKY